MLNGGHSDPSAIRQFLSAARGYRPQARYRLTAPLGYVPPVEANYYHARNLEHQAMAA